MLYNKRYARHTFVPWHAFISAFRYREAWVRGLEAKGVTVKVLSGSLRPTAGDLNTSFVIPHVLVDDYVCNSPLWQLACWFEVNNTPMLNSAASLALTSDKYATYQVWSQHHLQQPATFLLDELTKWPLPNKKMVLKPSYCDGGRWIQWATSLAEAKDVVAAWRKHESQGGEIRGRALLQEYIEQPTCIRVIAGPDTCLVGYEKVTSPGHLLSQGHNRHIFEPSPELKTFAQNMVKSCGGGLMGVDILEKDGVYFALEANGPFGFDVTSVELQLLLASFVMNKIQDSMLAKEMAV